MFPNYQQAGTTPAQPDIANALGQQRPGQQPQAPQQTGGQAQLTPGSSTSHHQMLQQALQQNPHLAAQIQQRLQPANVQVVFSTSKVLLTVLPSLSSFGLTAALDIVTWLL